ncbi:hypothetical protein CRUP_020810 [Coryphaenoides rupestris]|nr:hypothetical protein CRUP_020810 [Coryphaenoides rupestris]
MGLRRCSPGRWPQTPCCTPSATAAVTHRVARKLVPTPPTSWSGDRGVSWEHCSN